MITRGGDKDFHLSRKKEGQDQMFLTYEGFAVFSFVSLFAQDQPPLTHSILLCIHVCGKDCFFHTKYLTNGHVLC